MQGAALLNTTSISQTMQKVSDNFEKMFARKAYVHWYTGEGMDVAEFEEALMNVKDLISEYHQYQDMGPDEEDCDMEIEYEKAS
jgi:tubulin beta